jgi:hypothetical protein
MVSTFVVGFVFVSMISECLVVCAAANANDCSEDWFELVTKSILALPTGWLTIIIVVYGFLSTAALAVTIYPRLVKRLL